MDQTTRPGPAITYTVNWNLTPIYVRLVDQIPFLLHSPLPTNSEAPVLRLRGVIFVSLGEWKRKKHENEIDLSAGVYGDLRREFWPRTKSTARSRSSPGSVQRNGQGFRRKGSKRECDFNLCPL